MARCRKDWSRTQVLLKGLVSCERSITCQTIKWSQVLRAFKNNTPLVFKPVCPTSCCGLLVFLIRKLVRNHCMHAALCPSTRAASSAPALAETCAAGYVAVGTKDDDDVILNVERGLRGQKLRTTWPQSMRIGFFTNVFKMASFKRFIKEI